MGIEGTVLSPSRPPEAEPLEISDARTQSREAPQTPERPLPTRRRRRKSSFSLWRWIAGCGILTLALGVVGFLACRGGHRLEFEAEKPVSKQIDAFETTMLDLRFRTGSIRITHSKEPQIRVEGKIYVSATDQATARLKAEQVDLEVTPPGRFTIVTLPESGADSVYEAQLDIAVPSGVDLRLVLGSGEVKSVIDLPNRTDIQVGTGAVEIILPKECSTQVTAKTNLGDVTIKGFEKKTGETRRQLIYSEFNGAIGTDWLGGKKLEVSVNSGSIVIQAEGEKELE